MSDTLQEREDQKTPDWHNFVPQNDYSVRLCAICGFGKNDHYRFYPQRDQNTTTTTTDYCNECKGRPHAPWCSEYKEPASSAPDIECQFCDFKGSFAEGAEHRRVTMHLIRTVTTGDLRRSQSSGEHQPAARSGGDEWQSSVDGLTVFRSPQGEAGYIPLMRSTYERWQDDDPHWPTKDQAAAIMRSVVDQHNAHQALVAEREQYQHDRKFLGDRLEAQAATMANIVKERNQYRLALEIIRDSFWSESEPFEERVEYLQQTAKDILITVHEQRSTSE